LSSERTQDSQPLAISHEAHCIHAYIEVLSS